MLDKITSCINNQNKWRRQECLNLIASESVMSPLAEKFYISDFEGRYNEHDLEPHYCGTKFSAEIEEICNGIFREKFNTNFVDSRPISGGIANLVAYAAFTKPGDIFVSLGIPNGAHVSSTKWGLAGVHGLKNIDMVFNKEEMNIDVKQTVDLINSINPKLVMFGASMFLFPEPVKEIKDQIDPEIKIIYDSSHVFGLVYNREFQDPLKEGADLITSSTHKTFQGPQGGIIIGNQKLSSDDWKKIQTAIFPGIISSHHIHRLPSLAVTALEMNEFGEDYARQTIKNAKSLGQNLYELGFKVLCPNLGFTESHQVIVDVKEFGGGKVAAEKLEENNIICSKTALPTDSPHDATKNPSGIRLGSQELTRWGMKENEMKIVAELFKKVLIEKAETESVKSDINEMKRGFSKINYCFDV
jgi:glycine hydroxymethyltransferase